MTVAAAAFPRAAAASPTCPTQPCAGNAWHLPGSAEPGIASSMRDPARVPADAPVVIYSGNQFAGAGGNPGNQLQAGSAVLHRVAGAGAGAFAEAPMTFVAEIGNNKYYSATLPAVPAGTEVEYYLRIAYSDHPTTFVHGTETSSRTTLDENAARAEPFRFVALQPLEPGAGSFLALADQGFEARLYEGTGHLALVSGGETIAVAPPLARVDGAWLQLGAVTSEKQIAGGLEVTQTLGARTVTARLGFPVEGVLRYEVTDWGGPAPEAVELFASSPGDERFYGLGEKFDRFDQSEKVARMVGVDAPGDKGDLSYKVVPWFVSTRGYGFHLDSTVVSDFDLRATHDDRWLVTLEHGALAFHLIAGPGIPEALTRFTAIAGRPPLSPPWAFAPWISSDIWRDGGEVRYVIERSRELGIPGSVLVFDSPWEIAYNDFVWNEVQFAQGGTYEGTFYEGFSSAADMLAFLGDHGFKAILWMTPFINLESFNEGVIGQNLGRASIYDEAAAAGYLVRQGPGGPPLVVDWWKGRGSPIDFTNPAARAWLQEKLLALVADSGGVIAGFKTDDGESDFIPLDATYFDGRTGVEMKNAYSVEYHGAVWEVLGTEGILWARSGYTGTQAYPGHWAGDNEPNFGSENGLKSVIIAGLSAAMSGWSIWGHDIGAYLETNPSSTPENLFMRWTQFGALSPIMQIHRQVGAGLQYPWSYGDEALENYLFYARLHTSLFPYLYTYVAEAERSGLPIIRPPVLHHQDDPATHQLDYEYYFGEWLYVAPVVTNLATTRSVYLPEGVWYDLFTQEEHAGGREIQWSADDQKRMPLFVRGGAILPMLPEGVDSLIEVPSDLVLAVYPGATDASSFAMYDGSDFSYVAEDHRLVVSLQTSARPITLRVLSPEPLAVRRDGAEVEFTRDGAFTVVSFAHDGGDTDVVFSFTDDPDGPGAGSPTGGCGCRAGTAGAGAVAGAAGALFVLALVAMGFRTRRRR